MIELLKTLSSDHMTTIAVAIVGYALKKKIDSIDKVSILVVELTNIKEKLTKMDIKLDAMNKHREEFIVLKSEVKTQWLRVDELKDRIKETNAI